MAVKGYASLVAGMSGGLTDVEDVSGSIFHPCWTDRNQEIFSLPNLVSNLSYAALEVETLKKLCHQPFRNSLPFLRVVYSRVDDPTYLSL